MRIATWNVNAINPRLDKVLDWLQTSNTDVLCLQETKCPEADFPTQAFADLGYDSHALGDGRWNGVAVVSRVGLTDLRDGLTEQPLFNDSREPRALGATCAGVRVWSLYVPNGREVENPHYQYKLDWLAALRDTAVAEAKQNPDLPLLLLGDFNVAPTDADVWDRSAFDGATHVTDSERAALTAIENSGFCEIKPRPLKYDVAYTFWDYRQLAFPKNRGMRIDLAYLANASTDLISDAFVDREARKGKGTSDHAPIVIDVDLKENSRKENSA